MTSNSPQSSWLLADDPTCRDPDDHQLAVTEDTTVHDGIYWLDPCLNSVASNEQDDARVFVNYLAWLLVNAPTRLTVNDCRLADNILDINITRQ
jgi:hypothetical protein